MVGAAHVLICCEMVRSTLGAFQRDGRGLYECMRGEGLCVLSRPRGDYELARSSSCVGRARRISECRSSVRTVAVGASWRPREELVLHRDGGTVLRI